MVLGLGLVVLLSLVASTVVAAVVRFVGNVLPVAGRLIEVADFAVWVVILTVSFAVIYKVLPDVKAAWGDIWVGAAVAGVLFTVGKALIAAYLARSTTASAFGAAGSLVVFLLWVYYSAQVFLLCAEFTQVYARRCGTGIVPDENSVRVLKTYEGAGSELGDQG
jgi:membrane protein